MENFKELLETIKEFGGETKDFVYLDEEHKRLDTETTVVDDNIFLNKKVSYDDEDRAIGYTEEVFFGSGMKKKKVGNNIRTITYEDGPIENVVSTKTEIYSEEKGTTITVTELTSVFDKKTETRTETETIYNDKTGKPRAKTVLIDNEKESKRTEYIIDKSGDEIEIEDAVVDKETNVTTVTSISPDKTMKRLYTVKEPSIDIKDAKDLRETTEEVFRNGVKVSSSSVTYITKGNKLIRTEKMSAEQMPNFMRMEDVTTLSMEEGGIWAIESIKKSIDNGKEKEHIQSYNEKDDKTSTVMLPGLIIINNLYNRSNASMNMSVDPVSRMPIKHIKYVFNEEGLPESNIEYINGNLYTFLGHYKINDGICDAMLRIEPGKSMKPVAAFKIVYSDKEDNILYSKKFNLLLDVEEEMSIFNNIFNLLIKDIEGVYGEGCLKIKDQNETVLQPKTTFSTLETRQNILRR